MIWLILNNFSLASCACELHMVKRPGKTVTDLVAEQYSAH